MEARASGASGRRRCGSGPPSARESLDERPAPQRQRQHQTEQRPKDEMPPEPLARKGTSHQRCQCFCPARSLPPA